jgi:glycerol-3-phosphate dehydrogenase
LSPPLAAPAEAPAAGSLETEVLIIGGGVTGAGVMRDLALRGIHSILIDKVDLCAGASGGNHGLLHSGARYVGTDLAAAIECRQENERLKRLAPQCIEATGGLFVAVEGDDAEFAARFAALCRCAGIPCEELGVAQARELEPQLSPRLVKAFRVPDAAVDPFHLALAHVDHARVLQGSLYRAHTELVRFELDAGGIRGAICRDNCSGATLTIRARQFVNAGGAWAMKIARLAGCTDVELVYAKGTLLVNHDRITRHVVNRLRPPADGDILVPGGTVSLLGTTSARVADPEQVGPTVEEVDRLIREGAAMIPALADARYTRAFSRVRPLLQGATAASDRAASRGFALLDHQAQGLANLCTITGGKLTTFRLMAERAADLVARRLGRPEPGITGQTPLPDAAAGRWTDAGKAARQAVAHADPDDPILCECEMVPRSAIDEIVAAPAGETAQRMGLEAIALRSRVGKGPCQGSFCGIRVGSYLYDRGHYRDSAGLREMRRFFDERFKGQRPVVWGPQAAQMELAEALHCGLLGLDLLDGE